jgi:hypothetical protein
VRLTGGVQFLVAFFKHALQWRDREGVPEVV